VVNPIISSSQSAFIKGRHVVEGVLIVNEVLDLARTRKHEFSSLKVDFEKAYDSVDWGFLEYMLIRCGYYGKWMAWMKACVFGWCVSILVNGSPTKEINIQSRLKQGDSLAPFLFHLVTERFSGLMRNVVDRNLYKGFEVNKGCNHIASSI